jgi:Predicted nucleic acid-binding protein, consists of a PIN domain and a Zn-ribbon module
LDSRPESKFALDATAFYQGFHLKSKSTCITSDLVFDEISHIQRNFSILDTLVSNRRIMIFEPDIMSLRLVRDAAKQTGEERLTDADISILALAKGNDATLVTDDFAVCNLANILSIKLLNLGTKGIRDTRKWVKFCKSCGRGYAPKHTICAICGNKLSIRYKKITKSEIT